MAETQDWRARRWEETHRRIYAVALRLFQEQGFEQVSVGQIATESSVSAPTFYAHFANKEAVVLQLPNSEQLAQMLAGEPIDLPIGMRLRQAARRWFAGWSDAEQQDMLDRWRVVCQTPSLRFRAAEFERTTAHLVADALPEKHPVTRAQSVIVNAYLATYTAGLLAWADGNGEEPLQDLIDAAFRALEQGF